jgi:hypothetical protein
MALKRKANRTEEYSSSNDDTSPRPRLKRACQQPIEALSRRTRLRSRVHHESATRDRVAHESRSHNPFPSPPPEFSTSHAARQETNHKAEFANFADYNMPPIAGHDESDSDDYAPRSQRLTRSQSSRAFRTYQGVRDGHVNKRTWKQAHKSGYTGRFEKESAWLQDQTSASSNSSGASDSEDDGSPRTHSHRYPPKRVGVQNTPLLALPGELRNGIYQCCMVNEAENILNLRQYLSGAPRRSGRGAIASTNFAHSSWGFSQSCRQVRKEFAPWLLAKRSVRTPLATINEYVDTFHRPDPVTGMRIGHIEPIFTGATLPGEGVEILQLLKHQQLSKPEFRLQLIPTTVSATLDLLQPVAVPGHYDELSICRDMENLYAIDTGNEMNDIGIKAVHVTSFDMDPDDATDDSEDDDSSNQIVIELEIGTPAGGPLTRNEQIDGLNHFVFKSKLSEKKGVELRASFAGGKARWEIEDKNVISMRWQSKKKGRKNLYRRLTTDHYVLNGFEEEDLD